MKSTTTPCGKFLAGKLAPTECFYTKSRSIGQLTPLPNWPRIQRSRLKYPFTHRSVAGGKLSQTGENPGKWPRWETDAGGFH